MPGETGRLSFIRFSIMTLMARRDLAVFLIAREELIERLQFAQRSRLQRSAHVLVDKQLEPIPQRARLRGVCFFCPPVRARMRARARGS